EPGMGVGGGDRERGVGQFAQHHHVVVAQVEGIAQAAQDIVVDHRLPHHRHGAPGPLVYRPGRWHPPIRQRRVGPTVTDWSPGCFWSCLMSRIVLITGATSGFGAAAVHRFAKAGWKVIATGRRGERLRPLVEAYGAGTVHAAVFDIRDAAAMEAAL